MIIPLCFIVFILCSICLYLSYAFTSYNLKTEKAKVRFLRFFEVISGSTFFHIAYDILVALLLLSIVSCAEGVYLGIRIYMGFPIDISTRYILVKAISSLLFTLIASYMVEKFIYSMHQRVYTALINAM